MTTFTPDVAANFGQASPLEHDLRYRKAAEFVDVVCGLWNSWEEGGRVADRASGLYMDATKLHVLDHDGEFYKVKGPLNATRSPQGRPVLVQAGSSASGQAFAAGAVEVMFTVQQDIDAARTFYAGMKAQVAARGRNPDHCKILPGLLPIVGRTDAEAQEKLTKLMSFVDDSKASALLSHRFGHDMSAYPLDGPVPKLPPSKVIQSFATALEALSRREGTTLRDIYNNLAAARGYLLVCGTPATIADTMEHWFTTGAADGFVIIPATIPTSVDDFVDLVVPELQRRGLFRTEYAGTTLRDHLGLPQPQHPACVERPALLSV